MTDWSKRAVRFAFLLKVLLIGAFLLTSAAADLCRAAESPAAASSQPERVVRVGYYPFTGFLMVDSRGKRSGYGYEYMQILRGYTNWKYQYTGPEYGWPDMLGLLRDGKIDLVPGVTKTAEREAAFAFSKLPIIRTSTILTVKAGNTRFRSVDYSNWNGMRVGLLQNTTQADGFAAFAKEKRFDFQPVLFRNPKALAEALQTGTRIDAAVSSSLRNIDSDEWILEQFNTSNMYIAVRKDDHALLSDLNAVMEQIELRFPNLKEELRRQYYTQKHGDSISFDEREQSYLDEMKAQGKTLTCILNPDRKPLSWYEDGEYHGIFKDCMDEIAERTGLVFVYAPVLTREEYRTARLAPEIDLICDAVMTHQEAEQNGIRLSHPYFSASVSLLCDKNAVDGVKVVSLLDHSDLSEAAARIMPGNISRRKCSSTAELIAEVKSKQSDAAYLYTQAAELAIHDDMHNQLAAAYIPGIQSNFMIGIRERNNPLLLSVIDKTILSFDEGFSNHLCEQYMPRFSRDFSLSQFFHNHTSLAVGIPLMIFALICVIFGFFVARRKKIYQVGILFSKLPLRCFVMDEHGVFLHYTLGQRSVLAKAPKLRSVDDIPGEDIRRIIRSKLAAVLATGQPEFVEFVFDGQYRSAILSKLPDSAFGCDTAIWISQDVSELKRVEKERNSVLSQWESAVNAAPLLMFIKSADDDFRYLQCNKHFGSFVGRTPAEILGHTDAELFHRPQDANAFRTWDQKIMDGGAPQEIREKAVGANGKMYHFQTIKIPFRDGSGKSILIGMSIDVTEMELQRSRLENMNRQLEIACRLVRSVAFKLNLNTMEIMATEMLPELWPMKNGKVLPPITWVYPGDLQDVEEWLTAIRLEKDDTLHQISFRTDWFGKRRYYRTSVQSEWDASGDVWLTGATQDVTELVESAEKLQENSLMWKNVMDELPVLFFVKDAACECRYVMCNRANAEFLGKSAESVLGKTTQEICKPGPEVDAYCEAEERILRDNSASRTRINIPDATGLMREMEKIELPVMGKDGRKLLVGIAFDITEREQALRLAEISANILSGIVMEPDFDKVLDIVGESAIRILKCTRVIFAKCDQSGQLHFYRECLGLDSVPFTIGSVGIHEKVWNRFLPRLNANEIICFNRMSEDPALAELCQKFPVYNKTAIAAAPIVAQGKLVGLMLVSFSKPRSFTDVERRMLRATGDCLLIAVNRAEKDDILHASQQEQARQQEDRTVINECLRSFIQSSNMSAPFEEIMEIIRRRLGAAYCIALRIEPESHRAECFSEAAIAGAEKICGEKCRSFELNSVWYTKLQENGIVPWRDLTELDIPAHLPGPWRDLTEKYNICSVWDVALTLSGKMWGSLEIIYNPKSERSFSMEDEAFIRSAARLMSLILMRSLDRDNLIQTNDRLAAALKKAQDAEKAKTYFLASMSHEIRTPLNAVIGFAEMMKDSVFDHDTQVEYLENIYASGNALLQLINDILDLSKMEADQMPIIPELVNFPDFCQEVCRPFQYTARQKSLDLLVRVPETMPPLLLDHLRIRQILFNLIGNAIKFTKEGYVKVSAVFTPVSTTEGSLLIQISDTGIGISPEDQKKIFEPFVQLSKMRGTYAGNNGTGLGLAIVCKLVNKMGGTLTLTSNNEQGSMFSILLPRVGIASEQDGAAEQPASPPLEPMPAPVPVSVPQDEPPVAAPERIPFSSRTSPEAESTLENTRVLLVDDSVLTLKILSTMLKHLHVPFEAVNSGKKALEKLRSASFDVVLTDLLMPEMNGVDLACAIRKNPAWNPLRIVAVTTEKDALPYDKILFSCILMKPIGIARLRESLLAGR